MVDRKESTNVPTKLAERAKEQHAPNRAEFKAIIIKEVEQSSKSRNIANVCRTIVPKKIEIYKSAIELGLKTAHLRTHAESVLKEIPEILPV